MASEAFEKAANISEEYKNQKDTTAIYYAGNSADLAGNRERALNFYKKANS
ncbi:MAG: hypothetical protein U5L09_00430 [Bacteroidales bacterium]|nr:hypothetical protein [Bacteroidales bacterium]